jgi:hypothetical protein
MESRRQGTIGRSGPAARNAARNAVQETTVTPAAVTLVANTAKNLLAANANRIRATIYNPLATTLYVRKATLASSAATASAGGYDFTIVPFGTFISDPYEWAGGYNGICATAGDVNVSESV